MKKKFLALVMTLSMVLSLVPMTALATEDSQANTVAAGSQSASEGANEGKQESGSNTDGVSTTTGSESSTDTNKDPDTNTGDKDESKNGESENTGGTTTGDSSTSGTGSTEGGGTEGGSIPSSGGTTTEGGESTTTQEPSNNAAKIDGTEYETLDEAIAAAGATDVIELLNDCELTIGEIKTPITIQGNGKTVTVPEQEKRTNHEHPGNLGLESSLTFKNTKVFFENTKAWSLIMTGGAVLTLDEKSVCTFESWGVYAYKDTVINVQGGSELKCSPTSYTAMMAEDYANLNVQGKSSVILHGGNLNGITCFNINVMDSNLSVTNYENQGLVKCNLTLSTKSVANLSGNETGYNMYSGNALTVESGCTIKLNNNKFRALMTQGRNPTYIKVEEGATFEATENGISWSSTDDTNKHYASMSAITIGVYGYYEARDTVLIYRNTDTVTFEEGANVNVSNNYVRGFSNFGTLNINSQAVIKNNGTLANGEAENDRRVALGGGIYNGGTVNMAGGVQLYNNHSNTAGDDIYNEEGATLTFGTVGDKWILSDCNDKIYGWYDDSTSNRWNAHHTAKLHIVEFDPTAMNFKDISTIESDTEKTEKEVAPLALKAAHPLLYKVSYVMSGEIPEQYKNKEPEQKFYAANSQYTIADTFPSVSGVNDNGVNGTFSFSGWSFTQGGTPVSGERTLTKDVTLYGEWTFTKKSSGHRPSNPTVTIPDDVPTGLDLKNHYGYIIGYPVDYYTGKPTTDQTKKPVRPEGKITRAEVATIYFRMLTDENRAANWNQVSGFSDVKSSAWYNNAISTLTKAGILKGYEDGTFQPNGYITRAEFATIAIRFFSGVYEGEDLFPDIKGHWAEDYINNAANKGLVKGYEDGTFGPDRYITRAEAVTLVNRTLNRHPHNDGLHQDMLRWPDNMDTSKWYYADMQEATNSHEPDKNQSTADKEYWGKMLPIRDWEALEKEWSNANSAPGEGEVV